MSKSTIHPLVKSYLKSLSSSDNYRGISIIPILTKLLEYIILIKCPELTKSQNLQFGYKEQSSTLHAEFLIAETIRYYNSMNSPVYVCSLDAEKAFDSCNWGRLFEKLFFDKGIPLPIVNVIKSLYSNSSAKVKYNQCTSKEFLLSQGVRQGSVLSPHLYNLYTDDMLAAFENDTTSGTSIHGQYTGIVMYADDIILMSTTRNGLQKLVDSCIEKSVDNCINFNSDKTEFVISGKAHLKNCNTIKMNGYTIHPKTKLKHLGFMWYSERDQLTIDNENIQDRINKMWSVARTLISNGIRFCHPRFGCTNVNIWSGTLSSIRSYIEQTKL